MKLERSLHPRPAGPAKESAILFWVGPYRMAIAASELQAIRKDRGLASAEFGCTAIVSAHEMFGIPPGPGARLLVLHPGHVAVRVDRVDRLLASVACEPLPRAFQGAEREWYSGLVLADGMVVPLVNPETLEREANRQDEVTFDAAWAQFKPPQETASS
jgi:hypothetical protein